jgi:hypothetical protein
MIRRLLIVVIAALVMRGLAFAQGTVLPEWQRFRSQYPYHVQGVAVSEPRSDGRRVVIAAEPPPHVSVLQIRELFRGAERVSFPRQQVGYDGWVQDAVAVMPPMSNDDVRTLVAAIHLAFFGTTYKAYALPIGTRGLVDSSALDLDVTAAELDKWLLASPPAPLSPAAAVTFFLALLILLKTGWKLFRGPRPATRFAWFAVSLVTLVAIRWTHGGDDTSMRFTRIDGGESVTSDSILTERRSGVYVSANPGLVICAVPVAQPLAAYARELRQFAIESDVILGGIKRDNHVLIVGRERTTAVDRLPPLRVETILRLASVGEDELAQSYERNNIYSGPIDDIHDWAPIYLSDALIDTEYGSLLNITDQLLKSWSMHGEVQYANFAYPAPRAYPFPTKLTEHAGTKEVTFNWNTKGAGYDIESDGVQTVALNRTGALPVDYLGSSDERLSAAEDTAYEYFARMNDPNLVRVVQYAGLYQLFRKFGITTPADAVPHFETPAAARIASERIVTAFLQTSERLERAAARATSADDARWIANLQELRDDLAAYLKTRPDAFDRLVDRLAEPRGGEMPRESELETPNGQAFIMAHRLMRASNDVVGLSDVPLRQVFRDYVLQSAHPARETWIRTPSVVISQALQTDPNIRFVGGHNLSAKLSLLEADGSVARGTVSVVERNGARVLRYNPDDASKVPDLVRTIGRAEEKSIEDVNTMANARFGQAAVRMRDTSAALHLSADVRTLRGLAPSQIPGSLKDFGWKPALGANVDRPSRVFEALPPTGTQRVVIDRNASGQFVVFSGTDRPVLMAGDTPSAIDAVLESVAGSGQRAKPVELHLRGFESRQGSGFVDTVEVHLPPEQRGRIFATLDDGRVEPATLRRVLSEEYDASRAAIRGISREETSRALNIDVDIPARVAAKPPLLLRVKMFFADGAEISRAVIEAVHLRVQQWVASLRTVGENIDLFLAARRLKLELRRTYPSLERIEIEVPNQAGDVYIVRLEAQRPAGERAA